MYEMRICPLNVAINRQKTEFGNGVSDSRMRLLLALDNFNHIAKMCSECDPTTCCGESEKDVHAASAAAAATREEVDGAKSLGSTVPVAWMSAEKLTHIGTYEIN